MGSVYSTSFLRGLQLSGSNAVTYTVPAGMVAVLRDLDVNWGSGTQNVNLGIGGVYFANLSITTALPATGATAQWRGRQVALAGEVIDLHLNGEVGYALSGYLLSAG